MNASMLVQLGRRLDDALNPIVVKELRQAVQSRFVVTILLLFLTIQLVVIGAALIGTDLETQFSAGRDVFLWLHGVMLTTGFLFVPIYTGVRLACERSDTNVDLLFISTLRPRAIVWGKFLSALVLVVLIYSACLPFLTLTYMLRGIDVPTIFLVTGIDALVTALAIAGAILVASLHLNRLLMLLAALAYVGALIGSVIGVIAGTSEMVYFGIGATMRSWDFWLGAGCVLLLALGAVGLGVVLATAVLSPATSNRTQPVRLYTMGLWLVTGGLFVGLALWHHHIEPVFIWLVGCIVVFCAGMFLAVSEPETWGPRLRRSIPRRRTWRLGAFVLHHGSAGGMIWACLMLGLSFAVWAVAHWWFKRHWGPRGFLREETEICVGLTLYALCYTLGGSLLRWGLLRPYSKPPLAAVLALVLLTLGCVGPLLVGFMLYGSAWDAPNNDWVFLGNPFWLFTGRDDFRLQALTCSGVVAGFLTLVGLFWTIWQYRRFQPLPASSAGVPLNPAPPETASATTVPAAAESAK